jgi:hypothetical protein
MMDDDVLVQWQCSHSKEGVMEVKKVTAIVRSEALGPVEATGVPGMSITRFKGYGSTPTSIRQTGV